MLSVRHCRVSRSSTHNWMIWASLSGGWKHGVYILVELLLLLGHPKNGCQRSVHKTYTHTVADNHCTLDAKSNSSKSSSIGTQFIVIERERAVRFIKPPPIQWSQPTIRRMALKACGRNWTDESQPATEQHAACTACLHTFVFCNNGLWTVASCSPRVHSTLIRDAAQWPARERVVYLPLAHTYIQMGRTERNFCRW